MLYSSFRNSFRNREVSFGNEGYRPLMCKIVNAWAYYVVVRSSGLILQYIVQYSLILYSHKVMAYAPLGAAISHLVALIDACCIL